MALRVVKRSRPATPGYFRPEQEGSGLLDWDETARRFAAPRNYWVNTASKSGRPHAMPVWGVWLGDRFAFSTSPESRKARNLLENPAVCVHLEDGNVVIVIEGRAVELRDRTELLAFLDVYNPKYKWNFAPDQVARGVFAVRPEQAFAWLGGEGEAFGGTATRWQFETDSSSNDG
jgi:nitroimidazol reductase NimA-like FMN-containing flavoprotein (pyridoxamine 5'-phosphate oxidase superfamily)